MIKILLYYIRLYNMLRRLLQFLRKNRIILLVVTLLIIVLFLFKKKEEGFKNESVYKIYNNNGKSQKVKIAVVMLVIGDNYRKLLKPSIDRKIAYCKKHNYDLIICKKNLIPKRHLIWSKIPLILNFIDKYDWILCSDADTLIMNDSIKLENYINASKGKNAIFNEEEGSSWLFNLRKEMIDYAYKVNTNFTHISTSEMLFKSCKWTKKFLKSLSKFNLSPYLFETFIRFLLFNNLQEQGYLTYMAQIEKPFRQKVKVLTGKKKFSYILSDTTQSYDKCLMVDFQGMRNELLQEVLKIFTTKGHKLYKNNAIEFQKILLKTKYCKKRKSGITNSKVKYDENKWHYGNTSNYDKYFQYPEFCKLFINKNTKREFIRQQNKYLLTNLPKKLQKIKSEFDKLSSKERNNIYLKELFKYLKIPIKYQKEMLKSNKPLKLLGL